MQIEVKNVLNVGGINLLIVIISVIFLDIALLDYSFERMTLIM